MKYVYHIVDITDFQFADGPYYHVGIFSDYEKALNWLKGLVRPIGEREVDVQVFEVRKYALDKVEWSGEGKIVARAELIEQLMPDDYDGELIWKMEIEEVGE